MRFQALLALLMVSVAVPAAAQQPPTPEKRIKKLEEEMRAVQRKVFPGAGRQAILEPEIGPQAVPAAPSGVPAGSAVADLTARVDALEAHLRGLGDAGLAARRRDGSAHWTLSLLQRRYGEHALELLGGRDALRERVKVALDAGRTPLDLTSELGSDYLAAIRST